MKAKLTKELPFLNFSGAGGISQESIVFRLSSLVIYSLSPAHLSKLKQIFENPNVEGELTIFGKLETDAGFPSEIKNSHHPCFIDFTFQDIDHEYYESEGKKTKKNQSIKSLIAFAILKGIHENTVLKSHNPSVSTIFQDFLTLIEKGFFFLKFLFVFISFVFWFSFLSFFGFHFFFVIYVVLLFFLSSFGYLFFF